MNEVIDLIFQKTALLQGLAAILWALAIIFLVLHIFLESGDKIRNKN